MNATSEQCHVGTGDLGVLTTHETAPSLALGDAGECLLKFMYISEQCSFRLFEMEAYSDLPGFIELQ